MSTTIDEKVVEMRFDNKNFEKNVQGTLSTLDKLKQKLNLTGASKGLENVNAAAKKVDLSGMTNAVDTVAVKFSYLQATIQHQLNNIVDSAVAAGKRIVSALTIDPIKTGFSEYETQINAVQTILANTESKGTTLQDVNAALDTLNTYADKTIYNFTEMTRNIGTFTAAGVDLETSVSAIQGIANLAAVSGSNSQQASTAMYQLSQALSSGTVKLMDWNSVVNAGMGGQVFQDALKQTARVHGVNIDAMIKKEGSFRETLQNGWLTSDILTDTLKQFTMAAEEGSAEWETYKKSLKDQGYTEKQAESILKMANTATDAATKVKTFTQLWDTLKESVQSGWTQSWETIIGDFGESKEFLTDVSNKLGEMIGNSAEARNKLLTGGLSSGWKQLLGEGIADEEGYKDTIKEVAKTHGVAFEEMIKKTEEAGGTFEDALVDGLKSGKINSDMLSESVHKMSDKMSKMSAKELQAAGYTEEHVKKIQDLSKGLKDGSISMDDFVKKMSRPSGRENLIQSLWNAFDGLMSVIIPIKEAFRDIFPAMTGEQLYKFTEGLAKFTEKLKLSEEASKKLRSSFKGVFAIFDIGITFVKELASGIFKLLGNVTFFGNEALKLTGSLGDWLSAIRDNIKESGAFALVINKIVSVLQKAIDKIKIFVGFINDKLVMPGFEGFLNILGSIWGFIVKIGSAIGKVASSIGSALAKAFRTGDIAAGIDIFNGGIFAAILLNVKKFVGNLTEAFDDAKGLLDNVKDILGGVKGALEAYQQDLKANVLLKIAGAIGILAASILIIATIDPERLMSSLGAIGVLFTDLLTALGIVSVLGGKSLTGVTKTVTMLIGMSVAVLVLASALKKLSGLDADGLKKGLGAIGVLLSELVIVSALMSFSGAKMVKGSTGLILMAVAMKVLASVCKDFGNMDVDTLKKGLGSIGLLLAELTLVSIGLSATGSNMVKGSVGLILMAGAFKILASVCKELGSMDSKELVRGLGAISLLLAELTIVSTLMSYSGTQMVKGSTGLVIMAASMLVFAKAIESIGKLPIDTLGKGLFGMTVALLEIMLAMNVLPKDMISKSIGMIGIATALIILSKALNSMGGMTWEEIAKGILILTVALAEISLAMYALTGALPGAAALLVISTSLIILSQALKTMGNMSWEQIIKGLLTLVGTLAALVVGAALLAPFVTTLLAMSGAITLFGLGCLATGVGIGLLAAGITALATALAAGATAISAGLLVIVGSLVSIIPLLIQKFGEGLIAFCRVIGDSATVIGQAITQVILAVVNLLVDCVPQLADGLLKIITGLLQALAKYTPQIVASLFDFLIGLLDGIAAKLPALIEAAVKVLVAFFQGIGQALSGIDTSGLLQGIAGVGLLSALMVALSVIAGLVPSAMVGILAMGLLITELTLVLAAIGGIAQIPGLSWLIEEGGNFLQKIGTAIGQFIGGIAGGILQGTTSALPQMGTDLSMFMTNLTPFIMGAKLIDSSVLESVKSLASIILTLTGANLLESLTSWLTGGTSLADFGAELAVFGPYMAQYAAAVAGINSEAVVASANAAKALSEMAANLPNSGGIISWFAGENDMSAFGIQLVAFGTSLKAYSMAVQGINAEAINMSVAAGKSLSEMASAIPNMGGIVSWFTGDNNLVKFGEQLISFGQSLKDYSTTVVGINHESIANSVLAASSLSNMASAIPNMGGMVTWFTGDNDLATFGENLVSFGQSLKDYAVEVAGLDHATIANSVLAAESIAYLAKRLEGTDFTTLSDFSKSLDKIGKNSVDKFVEAFKDGKTKSSKALNELAESMIKAGNNKFSDFIKLGKQLLTKISDGINKEKSKVKNAFKTVLTNSVDMIKNYYDEFYSAGDHVVTGFANGISENAFKAEAEAIVMAERALEAARKKLREHSPSRAFYEIGDFAGQGFVNALHDSGATAYKAGFEMAGEATSGLNKAITRISDIINGDIDTQPTIRPVLDLSDVESGAGYISSMFNNGPSIGVTSNLRAISSGMNTRIQNGTNDDVVLAINKLRKDLGNVGGTTYNVNGVTYDDGSNISTAVKDLVRAAKIERRI